MKTIIDSKLDLAISKPDPFAAAPWVVASGRGIPSGRYDTEAAAVYALLESVPERVAFAHSEILRLATRRQGIAAAFDETLLAGYANGILHIRALAPAYETLAAHLAELRKAEETEDRERALYYYGQAAEARAAVAALVEGARS